MPAPTTDEAVVAAWRAESARLVAESTALTGDLGEILASAAATLAACGASLSVGDVVITGSVVPPLDLDSGS